jgi:hypothetical protein
MYVDKKITSSRGGRRSFSRALALASSKTKKSVKARRKKSVKKAKAPSKKEKKGANSRFFLTPTLNVRFQSPEPLDRWKGKGLE